MTFNVVNVYEEQHGVTETDLKLHRMTGEGSGHSKAETSASRLHVPRRLAKKWKSF